MCPYNLSLKDTISITHTVPGNFSGSKTQEILVSRGISIELLRPDPYTRKLHTLLIWDVPTGKANNFGIIRSVMTFRLTGVTKDYIVLGSDSGHILILEYIPNKNVFRRVYREMFGKSDYRRNVPGEYLAVDPKGRAIMIGEEQKLVYILNKDPEAQLTISSPLEAHKSNTLIYHTVGLDVGLENPMFACLEIDCEEAESDPMGDAAVKTQQTLTFYELDLGLNRVIRKYSEPLEEHANFLVSVPGGNDGPSGVLICSKYYLTYKNVGDQHDIRCRIPRRGNDLNDPIRGILDCSAMHKIKSTFVFLARTEQGDIFKITLVTKKDIVTEIKLKYFDTVPGTTSMCISKIGFLFIATELGNRYLYQITSFGDDDGEIEYSSAMPLEGLEGNTFCFACSPLRNLDLVDKITISNSAALLNTIKRYQQYYYELLSDWSKYSSTEHKHLKDFIRYSVSGKTVFDNDEDTNDHTISDIVETIYTLVVKENRKWSSDYVYCGLIYNVTFIEKACIIGECPKETNNMDEEQRDCDRNKTFEKYVHPIPVFKIPRCRLSNKNEIIRCAYIDTEGRLYEDWSNYIMTNTLPKCMMVLPKDGYYQVDPDLPSSEMCSFVWLEGHNSPACSTISQGLTKLDNLSTVAGIGSLIFGLTSLAVPVFTPVVIASVACTAGSSLWTFGRCSQELVDRKCHKQSISVMNRQGRSAWMGIAGSGLGLASGGSTALLTKAVQNGVQISIAARTAYNSVTIGNIIINGIGVASKCADILKQKNASPKDYALLLIHICIFGNSIINVQLAGKLINSTQENVLKEYEANLRSNRHRREFRRMVRNTGVGTDKVFKNEEIIRSVNKIENADDFFAGMARNRKIFSAEKAKVSFADGKAKINDMVLIDPMEFSKLSMNEKISVINVAKPQLLKTPMINGPHKMSNAWYSNSDLILKKAVSTSITSSHSKLMSYTLNILQDVKDMGMNNTEIFKKVCVICSQIICKMNFNMNEFKITSEDLYAELLKFMWNYIKNKVKENIFESLNKLQINTLIIKLIEELIVLVETKADDMFEAFLRNTQQILF